MYITIYLTIYITIVDVRSLYTNIPYNEALKAVDSTLKQKNLQTKVIISFLKLILKLNNFKFICTKFLQLKRCAMATKWAPTYANIFMGICAALRNLVPYVQFKKREKHPRSVTFSIVAGFSLQLY